MLILNYSNGNCDGEANPRFRPNKVNDDRKKRNSTQKKLWKHIVEKLKNDSACHLLK